MTPQRASGEAAQTDLGKDSGRACTFVRAAPRPRVGLRQRVMGDRERIEPPGEMWCVGKAQIHMTHWHD